MLNQPLEDVKKLCITKKLLHPDTADHVMHEAIQHDLGMVAYLVDHQQLPASDLTAILSHVYRIPLFDLTGFELNHLPTQLISDQLILQHQIIPLWQLDHSLFVALSDPYIFQGLADIQFHTGLTVRLVLVDIIQLRHCLNFINNNQNPLVDDLLCDDDELSLVEYDQPPSIQPTTDADIDDVPLVRYVNRILLDAINASASDIHFEPYEHDYRIRFRLDGILYDKASPPAPIAARLTARLKVMARLDIAEHRLPQDGRLRLLDAKQHATDFRVSTCPTLYGEKVVLRLLNISAAALQIDNLGLEPFQHALLLAALQVPHGLILATGPTGSGKTATLYAALNKLNRSTVNISTVEDPVEIQLSGINQVNVNTKTGLSFAHALRAFLRQDPDILMVGEMRDVETAEIGIKAAQTGHLVLSTLHTNDVSQSLMRLTYMGIPAFNIAASIHLIIAQRLVRCLCVQCKEVDTLGSEALLAEGFSADAIQQGFTMYRAVGCKHCTEGYRGRTGIFEVVPISDALSRLMIANADVLRIRDHIRQEAIVDLRSAGLLKVQAGITSLAEISRVTQGIV